MTELKFEDSLPRVEIEGEGVHLKELYIEDADEYFALIEYDRDHLSQFDDDTAGKYQSVEDVASSIVRPSNPDKIRLGIWGDSQESAQQVMVGTINLTPRPQEGKVAEIGYWIGKEHTGHNYAAKAARAFCGYIFTQMDIDLIYAHVIAGNQASRITLEKAGFSFANSGTGRTPKGNIRSLWRYELAKSPAPAE